MGIPNEFSAEKTVSTAKTPASLSSVLMKGFLLVAFLAVLVLGFLYFKTAQENEELRNSLPDNTSVEEYNEIVTNIKSLVEIGPDEKINVARIDNPEVLQTQNAKFYAEVKAGQYLVVLPNSQRVLIYDKDLNKIVNFSSYTIKVEIIPEEEIPDSEKPLTIEIRYTADVTAETLDQVKTALQEASNNYIIEVLTQTTNSYEGLTIVLLNREAKPMMSQNIIAHSGTNSIAETLPEGEEASTADVVLILGKTE